jgi:hypothetical protein
MRDDLRVLCAGCGRVLAHVHFRNAAIHVMAHNSSTVWFKVA